MIWWLLAAFFVGVWLGSLGRRRYDVWRIAALERRNMELLKTTMAQDATIALLEGRPRPTLDDVGTEVPAWVRT